MNDSFYRVTGLLEHPMAFAGLSLTIFSFLAALLVKSREYPMETRVKTKIRVCTFLFFLFVAASGSRGALATACLIATIVMIKTRSLSIKNFAGFLALVTSIVLFSGLFSRFVELTQSDHVLGNRLIFWKVHWEIFLDHPLFGVGDRWLREVGRDYYYDLVAGIGFPEKYNAHNILLESLAHIGIIGVIFIYMSLNKIYKILKVWAQIPTACIILNGCKLSLFSLVIFGIVQNTIYDTSTVIPLIYFFWLMFWVFATNSSDCRNNRLSDQ